MALKIFAIATILVAGVEFHALAADWDAAMMLRGGIAPAMAAFWAAMHLTR